MIRQGEGDKAETSAKAESLTFITEHEPQGSPDVVLKISEESWG